jgi:hypothetical protein
MLWIGLTYEIFVEKCVESGFIEFGSRDFARFAFRSGLCKYKKTFSGEKREEFHVLKSFLFGGLEASLGAWTSFFSGDLIKILCSQ